MDKVLEMLVAIFDDMTDQEQTETLKKFGLTHKELNAYLQGKA